jgi:hydroxymethylglutaryl-CoA synthase
MIGITGYSTYVPLHRLRRETIAAAWNVKAAPGCKAVANWDEDALTMGQAAAWRIVQSGRRPEALYFASTSAPYWQRSSSALIAAACDLPASVATADFGGSLRAGASALRAALQAEENALVIASEMRDGAPESMEEMLFGDAAAAIAVGHEHVIAELIACVSRSDDFPDEWRRDTDAHVRSFASKYSTTHGYEANVVAAGSALLEKEGVPAAQITRAALASPDGRAHLAAAKALGIAKERLQDPRIGDIGVTGAAMPLLILAQALGHSQPGDLVLAIGYGDGADAFLFRVTAPCPPAAAEAGTLDYSSYPLYRKLREYLKTATGGPDVSNVLWKREEPQNMRLHGTLCQACGAIQYPITRVCSSCRKTNRLVEKPLARTGRVFTFTKDYLYDAPVQPTIMAIVDLDGGGRFLCQMTDVNEADVAIGMPVQLVLRRMREGVGAHHYYWKGRPR